MQLKKGNWSNKVGYNRNLFENAIRDVHGTIEIIVVSYL